MFDRDFDIGHECDHLTGRHNRVGIVVPRRAPHSRRTGHVILARSGSYGPRCQFPYFFIGTSLFASWVQRGSDTRRAAQLTPAADPARFVAACQVRYTFASRAGPLRRRSVGRLVFEIRIRAMSKELIASALLFVFVAGRTYGGACTGTLQVTMRGGESEVRTNEVRCPEGML